MAYEPNISPMGSGVSHGPVPDVLFPRTLAPNTPNVRQDGDMTDKVREHIVRTLREFGFTQRDVLGHIKSHIQIILTLFCTQEVSECLVSQSLLVTTLGPRMSTKANS
jgi:hypothetical protein